MLPEVKWQEATAPEQEYAINPRTMPRQLFLDLENENQRSSILIVAAAAPTTLEIASYKLTVDR